jgi:3-hydroxyacyl-[acyl-carrier-protein] dehydratase
VSTTIQELIPHRPPFLFVDDIVAEDSERLVARRTFRAEEDFYRGHYPGAPITPGVLLCEAVFQTAAVFMARTAERAGGGNAKGVPLLSKIYEVRFRHPVYPGETVEIEVRQKEFLGGFAIMTGSMTSGGRRILNAEFAVGWKTPEGKGTP